VSGCLGRALLSRIIGWIVVKFWQSCTRVQWIALRALPCRLTQAFTVTAETDCELAFCFCLADEAFPAHLITPDEIEVEVRGGANATRQINHILKPEFPAHRLLIVEVYTPSGNWSSYPPHKH
jgi:5-deoxy-glucuronate isomerase